MYRILVIARHDLAQVPRRPLYLFWTAFFIANAWLMSRGAWLYSSADTSLGTPAAFVNSEFQTAFSVALMSFVMFGFFTALAAGMPPIRDVESGFAPLLHATPTTPMEYAWGRFLGALGGLAAVIGVLFAALIFFNHAVPDPGRPEAYGPLSLVALGRPLLAFLLPGVIVTAGAAFLMGTLGRRPILVFLLPIAGFVLCTQFLWTWWPAEMGETATRWWQALDPSGFRWLKQNWLLVDRGIDFYNHRPVPYDLPFLLSRLAWTGFGLGLVALTGRLLKRRLRGSAGRRANRANATLATESAAPTTFEAALDGLGMGFGRPSFLRQVMTAGRFELAELRRHPALYVLLPMVFIQSFALIEVASRGQGGGGVFQQPVIVTSGGAAAALWGALAFWTMFTGLFFTVESLRREEASGFAAILGATPIPAAAVLLGKIAANAVLAALVTVALFLPAVLTVARGPAPLELGPFALTLGLVAVTWLFWIGFISLVYHLTHQRYLTYGTAIAVFTFTVWLQIEGEATWLVNWPLMSFFTWSDLAPFGTDARALLLNRLFFLALAALFFTAAALGARHRQADLLHPRRPGDTAARRRRRRLALAALAAVAAALGLALWLTVHRGFDGNRARHARREYWRLNHATFANAPEGEWPQLVKVEVDLEFEPAARSVAVDGHYDLVHRGTEPLPWLPVSGGDWRDLE